MPFDAIQQREVGHRHLSRARNAPEWRGMERRAATARKPRRVKVTQTDPERIARDAARAERIAAMHKAAEAKARTLAKLTELNRI